MLELKLNRVSNRGPWCYQKERSLHRIHFYSSKFMEWYFTFDHSMYETHIHLPIYVDNTIRHDVFHISKTPMFWELPLFSRFWVHRDTSM